MSKENSTLKLFPKMGAHQLMIDPGTADDFSKMNISSTSSQLSAVSAALQAMSTEPASQVQATMQVKLLQQSLQSQQDQTAQLMKMVEGKGQVIDIRV